MTSWVFREIRGLGARFWSYASRRRRRRLLAVIKNSGLFDAKWYLEAYPDVRDSGGDPARHYLESGWREGRDPGPTFCTTAYLKANSDVVALGVNPLVHYLEHGQAEGRGAPHPRAPIRPSVDPLLLFGSAAPCVRFKVPVESVATWMRAGRIVSDSRTVMEAGGVSVAKGSPAQCELLGEALSRLAWLSGAPGSSQINTPVRAGKVVRLGDCWHTGQGIFRTRWRCDEGQPVVIRALQQVGSAPQLVGENCINTSLDLLDLRLVDPYLPLLFLFADPDGTLLGLWQLTFPTLCRGGMHYPEFLALSDQKGSQEAPDIESIDEQLAAGLASIRLGTIMPLVREVAVDLDAADGARPCFQDDFRLWLSRVMAVQAAPAWSKAASDPQLWEGSGEVAIDNSRDAGAAVLNITSEMIPSISALCAGATRGRRRERSAGPLLAQEQRPAEVWNYVELPPDSIKYQSGRAGSIPSLSPIGKAGLQQDDIPLLALLLPRRTQTHEAELLGLAPAGKQTAVKPAQTISWLVWPSSWNEGALDQSLLALAEQVGMVSSIVFVSKPDAPTAALAERLFDGRVYCDRDAIEATSHIGTDLCGLLGANILLHDRTTVSRLAPLLSFDDVLTATALVVFAERRGRGALVTPADGLHTREARLLPGAVVPVTGGSPDFWIARSDTLKRLVGDSEAERGGRHLCCGLLSVSRLTQDIGIEPSIELPVASKRDAISSRMLVG